MLLHRTAALGGTLAATNEPKDQPKAGRARLVGALVLTAVLVTFVIDNRHSVRVGFIFTDKQVPLIVVLVVTAVVGAIIDRLVQWRHRRAKHVPQDGQ